MADKTFNLPLPPVKAVDNGDNTHSASIVVGTIAGTGTDTTFKNTIPPLKAVDNGDGTYSLAVTFL